MWVFLNCIQYWLTWFVLERHQIDIVIAIL